jgi:tRNA (guanine37-N1)-methyltransferase
MICATSPDRHRTVDDRPFGGGEGVLKPEPLAEALESLGMLPRNAAPGEAADASLSATGSDFASRARTPGKSGFVSGHDLSRAAACDLSGGALAPEEKPGTRVILLSAQGRPFTQSVARDLARLERVILICGRYEGVDERINELYCDMELSIGDYVLSGGELAAAVVLDATMRLIPGVLGNEASGEFESFGVPDAAITTDQEGVPRSQHGAGGLLDYPHYTRQPNLPGCGPSLVERRSPKSAAGAAKAVAQNARQPARSAGGGRAERRRPAHPGIDSQEQQMT